MLRIFLTLYFMFVSISAVFSDPCERLMEEELSSRAIPSGSEGDVPVIARLDRAISPTASLITYLSRLLEEGLLTDAHLQRFYEGLEKGNVVNPITEEEAAADPWLMIQRGGLERMIQSENLDPNRLRVWVEEEISKRSIVRVQRNEVHKDTQIPFQPMEFVEIPAGEFWMGEEGKKRKVFIPEPYYISKFQLTQWQWAKVMDDNPSEFIDGPESIEIEINGRKIKMRPHHAVEEISWDDIRNFFYPR